MNTPLSANPRGVDRSCWLHIRARRIGWASLCLAALACLAWGAAQWLGSQPHLGGPQARPPVTSLAPLIAALLASLTLNGADVELERSVPRLTAGWRIAHALAAVVIACWVLGLVATHHPQEFGSYALVRNTAGLLGMVLFAVTVLPPNLSWAPAFTYSLLIYLAAPRTTSAGSQVWAWPMQPGPLGASWIVAAGVLAAGVSAYSIRGPRQV